MSAAWPGRHVTVGSDPRLLGSLHLIEMRLHELAKAIDRNTEAIKRKDNDERRETPA